MYSLAKLKMPTVSQVTGYWANWKILLCPILQFEFLIWNSQKESHIRVTVTPKKSYSILWEITICFLNISSFILQNWRHRLLDTFSGKPEWYLVTWSQKSSNTFFWKSWQRGSMMTILFLKDTENNSFYWAIFLQFLIQMRKCRRKSRNTSWQFGINPLWKDLEAWRMATGLSIRKIMKVLDVLGQHRLRLKKILTLLCIQMEALKNFIYPSES